MTYNPDTLRALGSYWTAQGGVNLGVVGDTAHQAKGYSYHLGRSQLALTAYSRITARDRAGLSEAASAIDLGRLDGSLISLRDFSKWLVKQAQANQPGTSDIREVIYTADGRTVLRYDRQRGYASKPRMGEADNSHLTHTHISFYRDSQNRAKMALFQPYFNGSVALPDTSTEERDMTVAARALIATKSGIVRTIRDTKAIPTEGGGLRLDISAGAVRHGIGPFALTDLGDRAHYLITEEGVPAYVPLADCTFAVNDGPNPPPAPALDITAAIADAIAAERARIKALIG